MLENELSNTAEERSGKKVDPSAFSFNINQRSNWTENVNYLIADFTNSKKINPGVWCLLAFLSFAGNNIESLM